MYDRFLNYVEQIHLHIFVRFFLFFYSNNNQTSCITPLCFYFLHISIYSESQGKKKLRKFIQILKRTWKGVSKTECWSRLSEIISEINGPYPEMIGE